MAPSGYNILVRFEYFDLEPYLDHLHFRKLYNMKAQNPILKHFVESTSNYQTLSTKITEIILLGLGDQQNINMLSLCFLGAM